MPSLRATVVVDYQNVHLTGAELFQPNAPLHDCLVHPLHYSNRLINVRNQNQRAGQPEATLEKVLVYRAFPRHRSMRSHTRETLRNGRNGNVTLV